MKLYMTQRHYVYNERSACAVEEAAINFEKNIDNLRLRKEKFEICIYLSANVKTLPEAIIDRIVNVVDKFNSLGMNITFYPKASTSGKVFACELFNKNFAFPGDIYGLSDLDQFPLYTLDQIDNAIKLAKKMIDEDSLYCNGARNVPVILGVNKEANDLRAINELIFSLAAEKKFFIDSLSEGVENISASYSKIGDATSGFYLVNPHHKDYARLKNEIRKYPQMYGIQTFSLEYFVSMWAALNSSITKGYVYSFPNPYYTSLSAEEEIAKTIDLIRLISQHLASTCINEHIEKIIDNYKKVILELGPYFQEKDILTVLDIMKDQHFYLL